MKTKKKSKRNVPALQPEIDEVAENDTGLEMNSYENPYLQQEMKRFSNYSSVVIMMQVLTERDVEFIVEEAIIKKKCKQLKLNQTKLKSPCAFILANVLSNNDNILQELSLFDNRIDDEGVHYLAKALSTNNNNLKILDLTKNEITNVGAKYLAEMIKTNETLTTLLVAGNLIGNEGIQILANAIQYYSKTMIEFDFCTNELVNDSIVDSLIQLIKYSPSLKQLSLFRCNLSQNSKDKLIKMQKRKEDFILHV
ncbi:unnamed protein product, partial [Adineta steineri]